jgi:sterol desaturase/sphingolipid hydroxylase (fatty acid hydroxylase superfamily)
MEPFLIARLLLLGASLVILLIELRLGQHRGIYKERVLRVMVLTFLVGVVVASPLAGLFSRAVVAWVLQDWHNRFASVPVPLATAVIVVVADFCFYWAHRLAHRGANSRGSQWLWKMHRTHHAGKYMNITLTARINIGWYFVVPVVWVYAAAAYLGQAQAVGWALTVVLGWNLLTHTHFRWDDPLRRSPTLRPWLNALEHVIVTPGLHHTHHGWGNADGKTYRNFAVLCAFYDWVFGTLHIPNDRPRNYGLPGPYPHWAEEVFYPFYRAKPAPAPAPSNKTGAAESS